MRTFETIGVSAIYDNPMVPPHPEVWELNEQGIAIPVELPVVHRGPQIENMEISSVPHNPVIRLEKKRFPAVLLDRAGDAFPTSPMRPKPDQGILYLLGVYGYFLTSRWIPTAYTRTVVVEDCPKPQEVNQSEPRSDQPRRRVILEPFLDSGDPDA